jgi:hypothetical protein
LRNEALSQVWSELSGHPDHFVSGAEDFELPLGVVAVPASRSMAQRFPVGRATPLRFPVFSMSVCCPPFVLSEPMTLTVESPSASNWSTPTNVGREEPLVVESPPYVHLWRPSSVLFVMMLVVCYC